METAGERRPPVFLFIILNYIIYLLIIFFSALALAGCVVAAFYIMPIHLFLITLIRCIFHYTCTYIHPIGLYAEEITLEGQQLLHFFAAVSSIPSSKLLRFTIYMHASMHTDKMHAYTQTTCMHACMHACMHTDKMHACVHAHLHNACMHACTLTACMHVH